MVTDALILIVGALLAFVGILEIAEGRWLPGVVILVLLVLNFRRILPPTDWGDDEEGHDETDG